MREMETTTQDTQRCSRCKELKDDVQGRQRLCSECEEDMSYCKVCDEWVDRAWGSGCRHVQWDEGCGTECGCGTFNMEAEDHRESFIALMAVLAPLKESYTSNPKPLLPRMAELIERNNFWTFWHGPIIGGPPAIDFRYVKKFPKHESVLTLACISGHEQEAWGDEAIDAMQLGMLWLTSLNSETKEANKITAAWIRDFLDTTHQEPDHANQ